VGEAVFPGRAPLAACPAGAGSKEEAVAAVLKEVLLEEAALARVLTVPGESGSASIAEETAPGACRPTVPGPDTPCAIAAGTTAANKPSARSRIDCRAEKSLKKWIALKTSFLEVSVFLSAEMQPECCREDAAQNAAKSSIDDFGTIRAIRAGLSGSFQCVPLSSLWRDAIPQGRVASRRLGAWKYKCRYHIGTMPGIPGHCR
jgi:hypothetical protein